jgi:hypothetical protein
MISDELAMALVASFSALPFYHTLTSEGKLELVQAIQDHATDEAHAKRIKGELIYGDRFPSPGDIRNTALATRERDDDFHYEEPTAEDKAETAKWAEELAGELNGGVRSLYESTGRQGSR